MKQLKQMRDQALKIQNELKQQEVEVEQNGVKIVISGDQEIKELIIDEMEEERVKNAVNKAIKKSQKIAAGKLQQMSGGLQGMLGGS